ncbi:MAG: hypothetical protein HYS21_13660 [Deltaproteobacteria bacterium]|nr:hypothetical protein [Deltaproteobacteria bacterium]
MAIALTQKYLDEIKKAVNTPNVIIEAELDSGVICFGYHRNNGFPGTAFRADGSCVAGGIFAVGSDQLEAFNIRPVLKSVSSLQNKVDTKSGYSTRGQQSFVVTGRESFKKLINDEFLKNRRVVRKDGFIAPGFTYLDYAPTFTGKILDWSRKGDELTITVADDLKDGSTKIPVENASGTQYLDYRNMNPVDIIMDMLSNQLGIDAAYIDMSAFTAERDLWLSGWLFDRIITEPKEANEYLNELQIETNSFIVHDGEKITFKVFAPPVPGQSVEEWTENHNILDGSLSMKSGYKDNFYNRIIVYFDYDESGDEKESNFEAAVIAADTASQDVSQWNEISTKTIKSKWIRTRTYTLPVNLTGIKIYHASRTNGTGSGTITFNKAANTLQWTAPNGSIGEVVVLSKDGKYQLFDADKTKYIRVIATTAELPLFDASDSIVFTLIKGEESAIALASKLLNRYCQPAATVSLEIDINNVAYDSRFIKPTDLKDITTSEAFEKGVGSWQKERVMITSVRPDFTNNKISIEAIETKMYRRYGFISPSGTPDYTAASVTQKEFAFVSSAAGKVNNGTEDGYLIW